VARVNIYLPDDLAASARAAGLNVSALAQDAVRLALDGRTTDAWLASLEPAPTSTVTHHRALAALDLARNEATTRHA